MDTVAVVVLDPRCERSAAVGGAEIGPLVGALAQHRLYEALGLSVRSGSVRTGLAMPHPPACANDSAKARLEYAEPLSVRTRRARMPSSR